MLNRPPVDARTVLNRAGAFLAVSQVLILAGLGLALVFVEIPKANESMLFALVGGILTMNVNVNGFFFGSSQQTKQQADTIDHLSRASTQAGPTIQAQPGDTVRTDSQTHSQTRID
jgi:hypothetical protein